MECKAAKSEGMKGMQLNEIPTGVIAKTICQQKDAPKPANGELSAGVRGIT